GLQVLEDLLERHELNAGKEIRLYGEGGEDVILRDKSHGTGHLTEFLSSFETSHRFQHAIEIVALEDSESDENFTQFLIGSHPLCLVTRARGRRPGSAQL